MKIILFLVLCVLTFQGHLSYRNKVGEGKYRITSNKPNQKDVNGIEVTFKNGNVQFHGCNSNIGTYKEKPENLL